MLDDTMAQQIVDLDASKPLKESILALQLKPCPLLLLLGKFDPTLNNQVRSICSRVMAPIGIDPGALIVTDGGSGCAALMGQVAGEQDVTLSLLAITPHGRS